MDIQSILKSLDFLIATRKRISFVKKIIKQEMDNLQSTLFKDTDWYLSVFNSGTSTILVQKELNKDAKPFEVIEDENQILVKTYQQVITEWLEVVDILVIDV